MIYPDGSVPSQSSAFSIFNPVIKQMLCAVLKVCLSTVLGSLTDVQSGNRASVRKKLITLWEQCRKSSVVWPRMLQERSRKRAVCYQGSGSCADGTLLIRPRGDARWSVVQAILSLGGKWQQIKVLPENVPHFFLLISLWLSIIGLHLETNFPEMLIILH